MSVNVNNGNAFKRFFRNIYLSYIPNNRDNFKQIAIKVLFIICFAMLIISASYILNYFLTAESQENLIDDSRNIWYSNAETEAETKENESSSSTDANNGEKPQVNTANKNSKEALLKQNPDFKGWIKISNTKIDNPIYQTDNNTYYLNHNQKKQKSIYGALYFDYQNIITEEKTDKNLVVFGHEMKNGSMFGTLKKLRKLSFYKQNPTIEFSTLYKSSTYKIYAIFVLNADKNDDDGYIYNIYRQSFLNEQDFDLWTAEAFERSIINTNVDVEYGDNIITLLTCSSDFENSRLVVMAREIRENEDSKVDTSKATANPNPRYPKKWYEERNIK